ncbi:hypothetical protein C8F01DRAFT_1158844 [Mycena amicta]|nr:hypothetical protein C8F01DRAFT_1158844 [Mycena amicta]
MTTSFPQLPLDVLLEISLHLPAASLFQFIATCKAIQTLLYPERAFWVGALLRIHYVERHPLYRCTPIQELENLSLDGLKVLLKHTCRVISALQNPNPVSVRQVFTGVKGEIFFIPGTHLAILCPTSATWLRDRHLHCVDILTGTIVASMDIGHIRITSREMYVAGKGSAQLGGVMSDPASVCNLVVISLHFEDRQDVRFSSIVSSDSCFIPEGFCFLNAHVMGFGLHQYFHDRSQELVVFWNMDPSSPIHRLAQPQAILRPEDALLKWQYFLDANSASAYPLRLGGFGKDQHIEARRKPLVLQPHAEDNDLDMDWSTVYTPPGDAALDVAEDQRRNRLSFPNIRYTSPSNPPRDLSACELPGHTCAPHFGVYAVTAETVLAANVCQGSSIHFWTGSLDAGELEFKPARSYRHRVPYAIQKVVVSASGRYTLLRYLDAIGQARLGLLTLRNTDNGELTELRPLPLDLPLGNCYFFAVDESIGLVLLSDGHEYGRLFAIQF